jgi:hypothetical protein
MDKRRSPTERDSAQTDFNSAALRDEGKVLDEVIRQMRSPDRQKTNIFH